MQVKFILNIRNTMHSIWYLILFEIRQQYINPIRNGWFLFCNYFLFFFRYTIWMMCFFGRFYLSYWHLLTCIVNILHLTICDYILLFTMHVWLRKKRERENGNLELLFLLWTTCNCNIEYLLMDVRYDGGVDVMRH